MGYTAGSFTAGQQPTTAQWNVLWSNDSSFNDGTGIANIEIGSGHTSVKMDYKASVYRTTSQSIPNNTYTKVQVNTKRYDTGSNYDNATNYRFTAPVAGFYFVRFTGSMAGALMQTAVDLYVNGSSYQGANLSAITQDNRANTTNTPQWTDIVQLNANDYMEMYIWHNFGSAASLTYASATYALMWQT